MYDSEKLTEAVSDYLYFCENKPTRAGLADWLCVSNTTISNVVNGRFNGLPYTIHPHVKRIISNDDFGLIQSLFKKDGVSPACSFVKPKKSNKG